jgi:ATP-dependent Clp protease ATP-binding subunit ClpC
MFERFTERARQIVVLAQEEARGLRHHEIRDTHLLLGIMREEEGLAARILASLKYRPEALRETLKPGDEPSPSTMLPFTPRAKKVLELSLREALGLGHNYIGTEHVLLGLLREGDGDAYRWLTDTYEAEEIRQGIVQSLMGGKRKRERTLGAARRERKARIDEALDHIRTAMRLIEGEHGRVGVPRDHLEGARASLLVLADRIAHGELDDLAEVARAAEKAVA